MGILKRLAVVGGELRHNRDLTDGEYLGAVREGIVGRAPVLASLDLRKGTAGDGSVGQDRLVLTDSKIILVTGGNRQVITSTLAVGDVAAARVETERRGPGEYVWGALALVLAFLLWRAIGNPAVALAAGIVVAAMGVYLIADKLLRPVASVVILMSGDGQQLRCNLRGARAGADVYEFISRIYARKDEMEATARHFGGTVRAGPGRYSGRVTRTGGAPRPPQGLE